MYETNVALACFLYLENAWKQYPINTKQVLTFQQVLHVRE
jgi:hypothetical protein